MKIVAGLQVFEEIDFIEPCIKSCCDLCDKVIVVEGSWETTEKFSSKRSTDGTIEKIQSLIKEHSNLELQFFNGKNQIEHRQFIWEECQKHKPDWYLQGDGDEIFHEKDFQTIKDTLSIYHPKNCVSPEHYLFWNDLEHYEFWNTAGARFFNVSGLDLDKVKAGPSCNMMYFGSDLFTRHTTKTFFIYHPSYVKNTKRQQLKINHRSNDDGHKFPHIIVDNKIQRTKVGWFDTLRLMKPDNLPKYLITDK